ncbi:helix-turn-helix- domain containing protein, AraC type [gamma proteobacterium HTCC5015]|nr:helix-turn-helix- domain containing protein, AraC type [gamma proteobacterium HTCC5015]
MNDQRTTLGHGEYTMAAEYLIAMQEYAAERGVPPQVALRNSGLELSALINPHSRIGHLSMECVLNNIMDAIPDPWLGMDYGRRLSFSTHGVLGFAAQISETLQDAAEMVVQFNKTRAEFDDMVFFTNDEWGCIRMQPPDEGYVDERIGRFHVLSAFSNLEQLARRLTGSLEKSLDTRMLITFPQPSSRLPEGLSPGLSLHFDQVVNELRFPIEMMRQPLPKANPELVSAAQEQMEAELVRLNVRNDVAGMVRLQIQDWEGRLPTLEQVAEQLHMSPRTLKRRLQTAGTSYQQIKDSSRFRRAIHQLEATDSSLESIAELLGYSDASNFTKAFKSWAEMTPSEFRQRLSQE